MSSHRSAAGANMVPAEGETQAELLKRKSWRWAVCALISSSLAVSGLFYPTVRVLFDTWRTATFSHCFLIFPISLYLIWTRRDAIDRMTPTTAWWVLFLLAGLEIVWFVGHLAGVFIVQEFAFVAFFPLLAWLFLGTEIARRLRFQLAFLFFALPVGVSLISPLQDFTAEMAGRALEISGVPVLRVGRLLLVPNGAWQIARECSGIRFLIASITFGSVVAFLFFRSWWRRIAFLLASAIVPIIANGLRAYGVILLAYVSSNRLAVGIDHVVYGWIFFSILLGLLAAVGWKWRETNATDEPAGNTPASETVSPKPRLTASAGSFAFAALAVLGLLGTGPLLVLSIRPSYPPHKIQLSRLQSASPWSAIEDNGAGWKPSAQSVSVDSLQSFTSAAGRVEVYFAYVATGTDTAKPLIQPDVTFLNPQHWAMTSERYTDVQLDGRTVRVQEVNLRERNINRVVWSWYWVGGEFTASPLHARFLEAKERSLRLHAGGAIIAVSTEGDAEGLDPAILLQDFLKHSSIEQYLNSIGP
jgi:exosortase A